MARTPLEVPAPSAIPPALLRFVAARGHDIEPLVARFGISPDPDEVDVAPSAVGELIEAAAVLLAEPYLALRLPAELPFRRYSLGELAARAAPTLRDSLDSLAPHVQPQMTCTLVGSDWHQATPAHPRGVGRYLHEYALAYVLTHARAVSGPVSVSRVWFAHPRPRVVAPLERWFGTDELEFGAVDSGFTLAGADRPLATADPRLAATIAELVPAAPRSDDLASRVAGHVRARLPEPTTADDAASLLHMSARTLQRRLEGEGTSFTGVVDATREALARDLLPDAALPLAEVAYRTGFADVATFSRAFKRWTGTSPGRFRRA